MSIAALASGDMALYLSSVSARCLITSRTPSEPSRKLSAYCLTMALVSFLPSVQVAVRLDIQSCDAASAVWKASFDSPKRASGSAVPVS